MTTNSGPDSKHGGPLEVEHSEKSDKGEAIVSGDYSGAEEKTDPVEIALVRKLDRRIMLDRNALPQARLNTLEEDLGLKGVEYNTAISILFVGYLLMQGMPSLQELFIIEGSVTALVAVFGFFLLPDDPSVTRWLTEDERKLAVDRIRRDTVGQQERGSTWDGLKQACKDPKTWLFCFMQNTHISACSFNNFFPTIVRTMGFRSTTALLLTAPPYFVSGFLGIPFAWSSGKLNERTWHITAGLSLAIVGFAMSCGSTNNVVRYVATFLYATGAYSVGSVILGWVSNTLSQTPEKKAVAYSLVNVTANLAYIYCAYLWPSTDGPKYMMGFSSMIAFAATSIMCAWAMRFWLIRTNKKIRESEDENVKLYAY
ncbi:putative transporter [Colletotrichum higginsianum]|uniref:Putative transporter n=1 Tax=Colletotrichum higginsianum TaxID=80884 RepID=A0A4T0VW10_9PEZI|nr:putative transporter [Colletotrichum higginsianum]